MNDNFIDLEKLLNRATDEEVEEDNVEEEEIPGPIRAPSFWTGWVIALGLGWIIGMALALYIGDLVEPFLEGNGQIIAWGVAGAIPGAIIGFNQWFVLKNTALIYYAPWLRGWVATAIPGWMISLMIISGTTFGDDYGFFLSGGVLGAVTAIPAWLLLRNGTPGSALWIPINALAWGIGLSTMDILPQIAGFAIAGFVSGAISGVGLIRILKKYLPQEAGEATFSSLFS